MSSQTPKVHIVDDDEAIRDSLSLLLKSVGIESLCFTDGQAFLDSYDGGPGCAILDIRMPGMSGLDLQLSMQKKHWKIPIVFITGHGDVPMAVAAMREGAVDFLQKPFREEELLQRIREAMAVDEKHRQNEQAQQAKDERLSALTPRETEIANRIVQGQANKVIALELGISLRTVELHRARIMEKLAVRSVAELVRLMLDGDEPSSS